MVVIFVRHAESTHNATGDTSRNVGLSERGKIDAKKLTVEYDLVICSTLRRTRETLDYSSVNYTDVIYTPLCREIRDTNPVNLYSGEENLAESRFEYTVRIAKFILLLEEMAIKYPKILVVSHGVFLGTITHKGYYNLEQFTFKE